MGPLSSLPHSLLTGYLSIWLILLHPPSSTWEPTQTLPVQTVCLPQLRNVYSHPPLVGLLLCMNPAPMWAFTTFAPFTTAFQLALSRSGFFRQTYVRAS